MSFACRPNFSVGFVVNPIDVTDLTDTETQPTSASCAMIFASDGSLSGTGNGTTIGTRWHEPTQTGVGAGFWIRVTKTLGSDNSAGDVLATWLQLNTTRSWTWNRATPGTTSATVTIEIATDSGGVNIVASKTGVLVSATQDIP